MEEFLYNTSLCPYCFSPGEDAINGFACKRCEIANEIITDCEQVMGPNAGKCPELRFYLWSTLDALHHPFWWN